MLHFSKRVLAVFMAAVLLALNLPFSTAVFAADDNLLVNWNFHAENTSSTDRDAPITGWTHEEGSTSRAAYTETRNLGSTGVHALSFWLSGSSGYKAGVYQTVEGLRDGIYRFTAEITNTAAETTMYAVSGNFNEELSIPNTTYTNFSIDEVIVTGGTATVGFRSAGANSSAEAHIDHATFVYLRGINEFDTGQLESAIGEAEAKLDAARENTGTGVGQYTEIDIMALERALTEAKAILISSSINQNMIDAAAAALQEVSGKFRAVTDDIIEEPVFNGHEWQNQAEVVGINRENPRSIFTPFDDPDDARQNSTYSTMWNSPHFIDLNGEWDFRLDKFTDRIPEDFYKTDYAYEVNTAFELGEDTYQGEWIEMNVPFAWQVAGHFAGVLGDNPTYNNQNYPWQIYGHSMGYSNGTVANAPEGTSESGRINPVGSYIKEVEIPADWGDKQVFLSFMGVSQGQYVWVNGHSVGYGEDSFTADEFDITPYIIPGAVNKIAVRVYRWTTGGFLENQDMLDVSGILRDTFLTASPKAGIKDFTIVTDLVENDVNADADLNVSFKMTNRHGIAVDGYTVGMSLYKEDGTPVFEDVISEEFLMMSHEEEKVIELSRRVENPDKWSAEHPNQYDVVFTLYDADNNIVETVGQKVGFREIYLDGAGTADDPVLIYINGEPIYFKGVNRSETHPFNGKAMTYENMEYEIFLMKQYNVNSVRTSHYPQHPYMYELYNKYGIYVQDEFNIESHNGRGQGIPTNAIWANSMLARAQHTVMRDKNHPSVVMYSLGNEAGDGTNHSNNAAWIRANDPTRLIHYQGNNSYADMNSYMYPTASSIANYNTNTKPYVTCEYEHALGNAGGGLTAYIDAFENNPRVQGGWIWEWRDHSIWTLSEDGSYGFYGYGGDWDETVNIGGLSASGNFCADGIVLADGTPSPALVETKAGYQDIKMSVENDAALLAGNITFRNNALFTNANVYDLTWELMEDGNSLASGTMTLDIAPLAKGQVSNIPYSAYLPDEPKANASYFLNIKFTYKEAALPDWAQQDHVASAHQFELPVDSPYWGIGITDIEALGNVTETDTEVTVTGTTPQDQDFRLTVSKETGLISEYVVDGEILLENGPVPNFYRAVVDNDNGTSIVGSQGYLFERAWRDVWKNKQNMAVRIEKPNAKTVKITVDAVLPSRSQGNAVTPSDYTMEYTVFGNGDVTVSHALSPNRGANNIAVVGSYVQLPLDYSNVKYYGRGPDENYIDRHTGAPVGVYETTTEDMFVKRQRPQETGNRIDTRWVSVTNDEGYGLLAISHELMEFSALNYTADEISTYNYGQRNGPLHPEDLPDPTNVTLNLNHVQMGVGGETWSTGPYSDFIVRPDQDYAYAYTLRPITPDVDEMESSKDLVTGPPVLKNIYVNGEPMEGFDERIKEYTVRIEGWEEYPEITVDTYDGVNADIQLPTSQDPRVVITLHKNEDVITYIVHIDRNMDFVTGIYLNDELLDGFHKSTREFAVQWLAVDPIPQIRAEAINGVTLTITPFDEETLTGTIRAVSAWGDEQIYTITLRIIESDDFQRPAAWGKPIDIQTLPLGDVKFVSVDGRNNYYFINNEPLDETVRGDLPFVGMYPNRRLTDGNGGTADKIMIDETTGNKIYFHQNAATGGYVHGDNLVGIEPANGSNLENETIVMYAKVRPDEGPFELAFRDGNSECRNATDVFRVAFTDNGILYSGAGVTTSGSNNAVPHNRMTTLLGGSLNRDRYYEVWMVDTVNSTSHGHICSVYVKYIDDNGQEVFLKAEDIQKDYVSTTMQWAVFELSSGNLTDSVSIEAFNVFVMNTAARNITYDIEGLSAVELPAGDEPLTIPLSATVIHTIQNKIPVPNVEDQPMLWEIVGGDALEGISIDQNGVVTLTKDFTANYFEVRVSNPNPNVDWTPAVFRIKVGSGEDETANKTLLEAAINYAEAQDISVLNGIVKERFEAALTYAKEVYANAEATQAQVDEATDKLIEMIHMLSYTADPAALQELVSLAEAFETELDKYKDGAVKEEFIEALAHAREALQDETSLDADFKEAYERLSAALEALQGELKPAVDTSQLEKMIARGDSIKDRKDDYLSIGWEAFLEALQAAKDTLSSDSQEAIDEATLSLHKTILDLRLKPNKDLLENLLKQGNSIDTKLYSAVTVRILKDALDNGQVVFNNPEATQEEVTEAANAVKKAIDSLEPVNTSGDGTAAGGGDTSGASNPSGTATTVPKTGEENSFVLFIVLAVISGFGLVFSKRKDNF